MKFIALASYVFKKEAKLELFNLLKNSKISSLNKDFLIIETDLGRSYVLKIIKNKKPIFIRNIFPIDLSYESFPGFKKIGDEIINSNLLSKNLSFHIETIADKTEIKTRDIEVNVGSYLEKYGYEVDLKNFQQSIIILINDNKYYIGIIKTDDTLYHFFNLSKIYSRFSNRLNRAEFKLREALDRFNLTFNKGQYALDLGASPGGWTKVLLEKGFNVISIDKGELDNSLESNPNIKHIKESINLENIDELKDQILKFLNNKKIKILTNDMNLNINESGEIMNHFADLLDNDGIAIMTLKITNNHPIKHIRQANNLLKKRYNIISIKHLTQNRQELTLLLSKK